MNKNTIFQKIIFIAIFIPSIFLLAVVCFTWIYGRQITEGVARAVGNNFIMPIIVPAIVVSGLIGKDDNKGAISADKRENEIKLNKKASVFRIPDKDIKEFQTLIKRTQYLKNTIGINIIYREVPHYFCGTISTASLTIGFKNTHDTIAVISLCDMNNDIKIGDFIFIAPCDSI